ncbi:Uncharacterised protein [Yersinia enterocolitica]|nr:Uncharacterised protein [Yersinia enterocolitica]CQI09512.1 Uncharacterised protein [Yersinia enterocolitica]CRX95715.1 Uncharacterised protein [Yersinia enterocolitica]
MTPAHQLGEAHPPTLRGWPVKNGGNIRHQVINFQFRVEFYPACFGDKKPITLPASATKSGSSKRPHSVVVSEG